MKKIIALTVLFICCSQLIKAQPGPAWSWGKADTVAGRAVSSGNVQSVIAVGRNKTLWGVVQRKAIIYTQVMGDYKLTEYDNAGVAGSSTTITGKFFLMDAQADTAGNWYILGQYYDTVSFPGGTSITKNPALTLSNYFLFKLNAGTLSLGWVKVIGADYQTAANSFTVLPSGLYVAVDSAYTFIKKYDLATGNNTTVLTQPFNSRTSSLAIDDLGNMYLAGSCAFSSLNFNGHVVSTSFGYPDYIVRYNASGSASWYYILSDVTCTVRKITLANNNIIYYSGELMDTCSLGAYRFHRPNWVYDYMVVRFDSSGNIHWTRQLKDSLEGDANTNGTYHAAAMADSSLSVFAQLRGYIDWGNSLITNSGTKTNASIVNYAPTGKVNWIKSISSLSSSANHVISDGINIWMTGNTYDSFSYKLDTITVPLSLYVSTPYLAKLHAISTPGTSVSSLEKNVDFRIVPNPATNEVKLLLPENVVGSLNLNVTDILGRVVHQEVIANRSDILLHVGNYRRGLYFITLSSDNFRSVQKLVLQ